MAKSDKLKELIAKLGGEPPCTDSISDCLDVLCDCNFGGGGGSGGDFITMDDIANEFMEAQLEQRDVIPAQGATFVKDGDKYKATFENTYMRKNEYTVLDIRIFRPSGESGTVNISTDFHPETDSGNADFVSASGEDVDGIKWSVSCHRFDDVTTVEVWGGEFDSFSESELSAECVYIFQEIEGEKYFKFSLLPEVRNVPDAEGETVTAAEFNELLSALRDAGYIR